MSFEAVEPSACLVVVDVQNGIRGLPYAHPVEQVIGNCAALAAAFRQRGLPVVITTANSSAATPRRTDAGLVAPSGLPTGWDQPVAELDVQPGDHLFTKQCWGSFAGTDLEQYLRRRGVTQVVLAGVATGFGVESTARGCADRGFEVVLAVDAMTDMDAAVHENSVRRIFPRLGECADTARILDALAQPA